MKQYSNQPGAGARIEARWQGLTKLCWISDLHLDQAGDFSRWSFLSQLSLSEAEGFVLTGDIAHSGQLEVRLRELAQAVAPRPMFFVLGNHDYYFSSMPKVTKIVASVCARERNLVHLGNGEIVLLGRSSALIGHQGWADGRSGWGDRTVVKSPDHEWIDDFRTVSNSARFGAMARLSDESAAYFRRLLPYCLRRFEAVLAATHVPPFLQAAIHAGSPCGPTHQPHFCNLALGRALWNLATGFSGRLKVLCGHTHSGASIDFAGIEVRAAHAVRGCPEIQKVFSLS